MKNSALSTAAGKRNGFEFLLDMLTGPNKAERRKAARIFKTWTRNTQQKFIEWYTDFLNSDFVTSTNVEEQQKEIDYLVNDALAN